MFSYLYGVDLVFRTENTLQFVGIDAKIGRVGEELN